MAHSVVQAVFWVCGFLLVISAIEHYTRHLLIPSICWILLAGVLYGVLRGHAGLPLPALQPGPAVVLYVLIPVLIFHSSRKLGMDELRSVLPESGFLALTGPLLGMVMLGLPLVVLADIPVPDALLFGAVLSPTDPVAISAVFGSFDVLERLGAVVEGESLLNDGIVVVLFSVLVGWAVRDVALSVPGTIASFFWSVFGALALGAGIGALGGLLMRVWHELHNRFIGSLMPLIVVYTAFAFAEYSMHISGVLSVMAATLALGTVHIHRKKKRAAPETDRFFDDFWGFLNHLADAVLFFILGASMGEHAYRLPWYVIPAAIGLLAVFRATLVYGGSRLLRLVGRPLPDSWQHVLSLGGLRGALSVALLLMLPRSYAHRDLFLCVAFGLVLFTMLANTLAMHFYLDSTNLEHK